MYPSYSESITDTGQPQPTEAELLSKAQAGDIPAVEELYAHNFDSLTGFLERKFPDFNYFDAQDVAQEALLGTIARLNSVQNFGAYACRAAINQAISEQRRRNHEAAPRLTGENYDFVPDPQLSPEDTVINLETVRLLGRTLLREQPTQTPVVFAVGYGALSHAETAERFGIDPSTSKSRYSRGVRAAQRWRDEIIGDEEAS